MLVYFKKNWETFGRLFGIAGEVEHVPKLCSFDTIILLIKLQQATNVMDPKALIDAP